MNRPKVTGNEPSIWKDCPPEDQRRALAWIAANLVHSGERGPADSYRLKHLMQFDIGLYLVNGAFKGAMLAAGYKPIDPKATNWRFRYDVRMPPRKGTKE